MTRAVFIRVRDVSVACVVGQVTALGWTGTGSYMNDPWNWLDLMVVCMGYVSLLPGVSGLSITRMFRALRPLRTLTSMASLRIVVQSLLASVPALASVGLMAVFIFLVRAPLVACACSGAGLSSFRRPRDRSETGLRVDGDA